MNSSQQPGGDIGGVFPHIGPRSNTCSFHGCLNYFAELCGELTNLNFFSDSQLKDRLASTSATSDQLVGALRINSEARARALKIGFLVLSGLALLTTFPCSWLPNYKPGEIPGETREK
jgi:hypothetical protein